MLVLIIFILFIVGIVLLIRGVGKATKKRAEEKRQKLIDQANSYAKQIKDSKSIPVITPSVFLEDGEHAYLEEGVEFMETRAVRQSQGGFGGVKVTKRITVGRYAGHSESSQEWRVIDSGKLTLTNKRLIFDGKKGNKIIPLEKILSVETGLNDIQISIENKVKDAGFKLQNGYIWSLVLNLLKQVKDPALLTGIDLNIEFK